MNKTTTYDVKALKHSMCTKIDELQPILYGLARYLHAHPEISAHEINSVHYIKELLQQFDFAFQPILTDKFSTAFIAKKGNSSALKKIGFLAEYDALPEIGHGCGHNLISLMSIGAALAFNQVTNEFAQTLIYGCAAEETTGAKLDMADRGYFDSVAAALIIHPDDRTSIGGTSYATHPLEVTFIGKEAHVADPTYHGINALDALVDFYGEFQALKQTFTGQTIVGMIITDGGTAPNIVPAKATLRATIRSTDTVYLEEVMLPQIKDLAYKVAEKHQAQVQMHHYEPLYKDLKSDKVLNDYYAANFEQLGEAYTVLPDDYADGSTDVGNVSYATRTCQPTICIGHGIYGHTKEFACAAGSDYGMAQAIKGAKAMGMTAIDVLAEKN